MVPDERSALVLRELVDQYLPAEVAVTDLHRSMRRTTLGALGAGLLLTLLGHFVHALGGLLGIGIFVLLIAIFPALWLALLTVEDRAARRKRPQEREALLAGGYRDVAIETRRITLRGVRYLGVGVLVQVKDGTVVTLWVGKDGYAAEHLARRLIAHMDPALREEYDAKPTRQVAWSVGAVPPGDRAG
jgi:hypothetical protein